MLNEATFDSIYDYSSAFKYDFLVDVPKSINRSRYKSIFAYHSINIASDEDSGDVKEENLVSSLFRKAITLLLYIFVLVSFPLSFWICIKKVHALERIVLMRLGKLQPIRGPGFTFVLPFIDIWTRVNLQPQTFTVSTSQVLTADGAIVQAQSEVEYRVSDIVSYVTKLNKQEKSLKELGLCCLTNIISEKDQEDLENNKEYISTTLKLELNQCLLKWGLEILNIYLSSVKVLKDAEPIDALGTIMTALKAATGHSSDHATAVFPCVIDDTTSGRKSPCEAPILHDGSTLDMLKKVLSDAENKGLTRDVIGCFKFEIVGRVTNIIFCSFKDGHVTVVEGPNCSLEPDVSLIMTEDNMKDFIENKISPLEAYMDGRVMVTGDWSLLRPLAKMLKEPLFV